MEYVDCLRAEVRITGVLPSDDAEPSSPEKTTGKRKRPAADDKAEVKTAAAVRKAKATKRLFDQVFQRWSQHLGLKVQNGPVSSGLERLEPGMACTIFSISILNQAQAILSLASYTKASIRSKF
jgi:hypothetical protein